MTRVKICGIREEADALAAAAAGADFVGLVFANSSRQVTADQAKRIVDALKAAKAAVRTVGVFVNMPSPMVRRFAHFCGLDWIQLSGDEPWEYCRELAFPTIKAINMSRRHRPDSICESLKYADKVFDSQEHVFLLDSQTKGRYGGTGRTFDWKMARPIAARFPIMIAGGLTPKNVAEVIETAKPWGVDVSSGVETGGVKDVAKIKSFIEAVRSVDGRQA